jgi:hypothetical protein
MQLPIRRESSPIQYEVRGHHALYTCNDLFHSGTPQTFPKIERKIQATTRLLSEWYDPSSRDILGDNPQGYAAEYNGKYAAFVRRFIELPDTASVLLTTRKDPICEACVFGEHCKTSEMAQNDRKYLERFAEVAQWLGKNEPKDYSKVEEDSQLNGVLTSKKVLIEVLKAQHYYLLGLTPRDMTAET